MRLALADARIRPRGTGAVAAGGPRGSPGADPAGPPRWPGREPCGLTRQTVRCSTALPWQRPLSLRLDGKTSRGRRRGAGGARPDAMVVAAYGLILPQWVLVLDLPQAQGAAGCLNIHASLLPRWRGAAPIHRAIEAGDAATGVTIMHGRRPGHGRHAAGRTPTPIAPTPPPCNDLVALGGRLIVQTRPSTWRPATGHWPAPAKPKASTTRTRLTNTGAHRLALVAQRPSPAHPRLRPFPWGQHAGLCRAKPSSCGALSN